MGVFTRPPVARHSYVSTACVHGEHGQCRLSCKFCQTACLCGCHLKVALSGSDG